jgi:hypothetical protein
VEDLEASALGLVLPWLRGFGCCCCCCVSMLLLFSDGSAPRRVNAVVVLALGLNTVAIIVDCHRDQKYN